MTAAKTSAQQKQNYAVCKMSETERAEFFSRIERENNEALKIKKKLDKQYGNRFSITVNPILPWSGKY